MQRNQSHQNKSESCASLSSNPGDTSFQQTWMRAASPLSLLCYAVYKINELPQLTWTLFADPQQKSAYSYWSANSYPSPSSPLFPRPFSHTPFPLAPFRCAADALLPGRLVAMEDHPANLVPSSPQHAYLHDEMAAADG